MVLERPGAGVGRAEQEVVLDAAPEPAARPEPGREEQAGEVLEVALAQLAPRLGDVATNLARHLAVIREAEEHGAGLVLFPELSLTGYFLQDLVPDVAVREDSPEVQELAAACGRTAAVVGCILESPDLRFYNAALTFSGGRLLHVHRKVYLPTYGLFDEHRYLAAGDRFEAFDLPLPGSGHAWRCGVLICEDMWHPSAAALLARQSVDAFLCPSASPGRGVLRGMALGTATSYDAMTRTYAQLFTAYLAYCNRAGYEDGISFWGGARVVNPDGTLQGEPAPAQEALMYQRFERSALRRARIQNPLLRDERHDITDSEHARIRKQRR